METKKQISIKNLPYYDKNRPGHPKHNIYTLYKFVENNRLPTNKQLTLVEFSWARVSHDFAFNILHYSEVRNIVDRPDWRAKIDKWYGNNSNLKNYVKPFIDIISEGDLELLNASELMNYILRNLTFNLHEVKCYFKNDGEFVDRLIIEIVDKNRLKIYFDYGDEGPFVGEGIKTETEKNSLILNYPKITHIDQLKPNDIVRINFGGDKNVIVVGDIKSIDYKTGAVSLMVLNHTESISIGIIDSLDFATLINNKKLIGVSIEKIK